MNPEADKFIRNAKQWQAEFKKLRSILLDTEMIEEYKWGKPCYTINGGNVALIHGFKDYCAILFHKGVLLKDPENSLIQQTENVQSARQLRFSNLQEIEQMESTIKAYIQNAIEVEKSGLEVEYKETSEFSMPDEFVHALEENPELQEAFEALTPGRQRGYLLHFSGAKQSKTRTFRIEKCIPKIFEGKGLNDR